MQGILITNVILWSLMVIAQLSGWKEMKSGNLAKTVALGLFLTGLGLSAWGLSIVN